MSFGNEREFIDYLQRKEGKTMKCPLLERYVDTTVEPYKGGFRDCLKEECACWSRALNQCDPTGLLPWLVKLIGVLEEMVEKMPHELQFRK